MPPGQITVDVNIYLNVSLKRAFWIYNGLEMDLRPGGTCYWFTFKCSLWKWNSHLPSKTQFFAEMDKITLEIAENHEKSCETLFLGKYFISQGSRRFKLARNLPCLLSPPRPMIKPNYLNYSVKHFTLH